MEKPEDQDLSSNTSGLTLSYFTKPLEVRIPMLQSHATVAQGEAIRGQWSPCLRQDGLIVSNSRLDCL